MATAVFSARTMLAGEWWQVTPGEGRGSQKVEAVHLVTAQNGSDNLRVKSRYRGGVRGMEECVIVIPVAKAAKKPAAKKPAAKKPAAKPAAKPLATWRERTTSVCGKICGKTRRCIPVETEAVGKLVLWQAAKKRKKVADVVWLRPHTSLIPALANVLDQVCTEIYLSDKKVRGVKYRGDKATEASRVDGTVDEWRIARQEAARGINYIAQNIRDFLSFLQELREESAVWPQLHSARAIACDHELKRHCVHTQTSLAIGHLKHRYLMLLDEELVNKEYLDTDICTSSTGAWIAAIPFSGTVHLSTPSTFRRCRGFRRCSLARVKQENATFVLMDALTPTYEVWGRFCIRIKDIDACTHLCTIAQVSGKTGHPEECRLADVESTGHSYTCHWRDQYGRPTVAGNLALGKESKCNVASHRVTFIRPDLYPFVEPVLSHPPPLSRTLDELRVLLDVPLMPPSEDIEKLKTHLGLVAFESV